jgi:hypothetical protein
VKEDGKLQKKLLDYFHLEQTDGSTMILGDFADKGFSHWLQMMHGFIEKVLETNFIDGVKKDRLKLLEKDAGRNMDRIHNMGKEAGYYDKPS